MWGVINYSTDLVLFRNRDGTRVCVCSRMIYFRLKWFYLFYYFQMGLCKLCCQRSSVFFCFFDVLGYTEARFKLFLWSSV